MKNILLSILSVALCTGLFSQTASPAYDSHGNAGFAPEYAFPPSIVTEKGSSWTPIGPFGGDVFDIAIDPTFTDLVYLAAGYPYMRTNPDEPWMVIDGLLSLSPSGIQCIEANDNGVIYAGGNTTYGKIFTSEDQGASWQQKFTTVNAGVLGISIDPQNQDNIYVTTTSNISGSVNKVIVKSTDGGSTWTGLDMTAYFPVGMGCNDLAVDPEESNILVALGDGGFSYAAKIIISLDGGLTWEDITAGLPPGIPLNEVTIHDGTIYLCGGQLFGGNIMGIYISNDFGQSWQDISLGFPVKVVNDILIDPDDADLMYAATEGDGVYYSANGGLTWNYATGGVGDNGSVRKIIFNPNDPAELYAGFLSLGVGMSDDYGYNWSSSSVGIASLKLNDIEIDPANPQLILASYEAENSGGCYLFDPEVGDWALVNSLPATRFSSVSIGIDSRMYAWSNGPTTVAAEGVYRSSDGGVTWENMGPNIGPVFETQIFAMALSHNDPDLIFIGGNNFGANGWASMIYRSTDAGETWENVYMGPENDGFKYLHIDSTSNDQVVYAAYKTESAGAGFIKSTDGGTNWTTINNGIPASTKWAGAIICSTENPDVLYGGVGGYGGTPGKIYKSEDGGSSWTASAMNLTNYSKVSDILQSPSNPDVIYASTTLNGVFMTEDGESWNAANVGLTATNVTGFSRPFVNDDEILGFYAATFSNSAFYTEIYEPGTTALPSRSTPADEFIIAANPVGRGMPIRIIGATALIKRVEMYSIDGKLLQQIQVQEARNGTEVSFDAPMTQGLYQLVILTEDNRIAKKVIVQE